MIFKYKIIVVAFLSGIVLSVAGQPKTGPVKPGGRDVKPVVKPIPSVQPNNVLYTVELERLYSTYSDDGTDGTLVQIRDRTQEIYGAISVCLAAANYPATVQKDYTYKNAVDVEINGGVAPLASLSTNPNGRVLWRQSDGANDRRIHLSDFSDNNTVYINTKAVFLFDTNKDKYAGFRLFADLWESDASDNDEHLTAGQRRKSIALSEVAPGTTKEVILEIFDSTSRNYAVIKITAVKQ